MGNFEDLTRKKFNLLTVIKQVEKDKYGNVQWLCRCECGGEKIVTSHNLLKNMVKSCGCIKCKSLIGLKFGKLTILQLDHIETKKVNNKIKKEEFYKCLCDCGNITIKRRSSLIGGKTKSCGCTKTNMKDLTNKRFGKLTVIQKVGQNNKNNFLWLCQCDCGNTKVIASTNLISGHTQSCGCLNYSSKNMEDLTGQKFGKLTVIKRGKTLKSGIVRWICECECGNVTIVDSGRLKNGMTKSCGCLKHQQSKRLKDLTGQRFGRLTVIKRVKSKNKNTMWLCKCQCGNEIIIPSRRLLNGETKSCGCLKKERIKEKNTIHSKSDSRLYRIWNGIKNRCYNKNFPAYKDYGERGIFIYNKWKNNFQNFYDWAMANGYNPNADRYECTIDRIDVNKGYFPSNCRWVDMKTQANNTRRNHYLTYNGETKTITQWAETTGLKGITIYQRLKVGWSIERALTTPTRKLTKSQKP